MADSATPSAFFLALTTNKGWAICQSPDRALLEAVQAHTPDGFRAEDESDEIGFILVEVRADTAPSWEDFLKPGFGETFSRGAVTGLDLEPCRLLFRTWWTRQEGTVSQWSTLV